MNAHISNLEYNKLETAVANLSLNGRRQNSLIILADPMIDRAYYDWLSAIGKLRYYSNNKIILLSAGAAVKAFKKCGKKQWNIPAVHAVTLTLKRGRRGFFGSIFDLFANNLPNGLGGGRHELRIVVAGEQPEFDGYLRDLAGLLSALLAKGYIRDNTFQIQGGLLLLKNNKPVKIRSSATLYDLVSHIRHFSPKAKARAQAMAMAAAAPQYGDSQDAAIGSPSMQVNPATSLPMNGDMVDIGGNPFGVDNWQMSSCVNPSTGLPMMADTGIDVGGHAFGTGDPFDPSR